MWVRVRLRRGRGKGNSTPEEERGRSGESCPLLSPNGLGAASYLDGHSFHKAPTVLPRPEDCGITSRQGISRREAEGVAA